MKNNFLFKKYEHDHEAMLRDFNGVLYPDEFPNVPKQGREITHWMPLPAPPQEVK